MVACYAEGGRCRASEGRASRGASSPLNTLTGASAGTADCRSRPGQHAPHTLVDDGGPYSARAREVVMRVVYERCCGLDVHKTTVVACVLAVGPRGELQKEVRTF